MVVWLFRRLWILILELFNRQAHLEKTENEILELSHNAVNLKQNYLELTELRHVLEKTEAFFTAQEEIGMDSLTKLVSSTQYAR